MTKPTNKQILLVNTLFSTGATAITAPSTRQTTAIPSANFRKIGLAFARSSVADMSGSLMDQSSGQLVAHELGGFQSDSPGLIGY